MAESYEANCRVVCSASSSPRWTFTLDGSWDGGGGGECGVGGGGDCGVGGSECVCVCVPTIAHVWRSEDTLWSQLSTMWGLNWSHQAWWQVPLSAEPLTGPQKCSEIQIHHCLPLRPSTGSCSPSQ